MKWKYKVTEFTNADEVTYFKIIYDNGSFETTDYDTGSEGWKEIEQHYNAEKAGARTYKKVKADGGGVVEEWWDPEDKDAGQDAALGAWQYVYKELDSTGKIINHWYEDDSGKTHSLMPAEDPSVPRWPSPWGNNGTDWDHEPWDPSVASDGVWGEVNGTPFAALANVKMGAGSHADDFRYFG